MRNRTIFAGHMFIFALAAIAAIFYLQSAIPIGVGKGILANSDMTDISLCDIIAPHHN